MHDVHNVGACFKKLFPAWHSVTQAYNNVRTTVGGLPCTQIAAEHMLAYVACLIMIEPLGLSRVEGSRCLDMSCV
jgi:hypothetical protein